jgi:hypothetical protein
VTADTMTIVGSATAGRQPAMARLGVTLMETLIAIFVVTVGLLGLAALIPVGRWQMEEAQRIDNSAALGRAAFRNLQTYNQLKMSQWAFTVPTSSSGTPNYSVLNANNGFMPDPTGGKIKVMPPYAPVVLDPLMVAYNLSNPAVVSTFPYELPNTNYGAMEWNATSAPRLPRLTIANPLPQANSGGPNALPPLMPLSVAESYFRGMDDRIYAVPTNRELKPSVVFSSLQTTGTSGTTKMPATVQSKGDYTWFAVLSPSRFEVETVGVSRTRQIEASVVVCHKRALTTFGSDVNYNTRDRFRGERRAALRFISSGNFNQGSTDAVMIMSDLTNEAEADKATYLHNGEWIMVMAYTTTPPPAIPPPNYTPQDRVEVQFFQVLSVGRQVRLTGNQPNEWQRRIRLTGGNWTIPAGSSSRATADAGSPVTTGYAVIIDGAVAVYRKILMYDGQSMWSP